MNSKDDLPKQVTHGIPPQFPKLLHEMLNAAEEKGYAHICSWQAHGLSFAIHDRKALVQTVLKRYFKHHLFASFQRQLNLYGFSRVRRTGNDHKTYYHEHFRRDEPERLELMRRVQYDAKAATWGPREDPDFSSMYKDQQTATKPDDTTERSDTAQQKMASSDDSRHSASQASDALAGNAHAPALYQSLASMFPQQSEPEQYQLHQTLHQPALLTLEQALAQLTTLLTHHTIANPQYAATPATYPFPQQQQSAPNLYQQTFFSQQPAFVPEPLSNNTQIPAAQIVAALLLQSAHHSNSVASHAIGSLEAMQQQYKPQVSLDPFAAARLSSSLEQYLSSQTAAAAPPNHPLEQQQQQQHQMEVSSLSTLNPQQRALLLQTLLGVYLNTSDVSQQPER